MPYLVKKINFIEYKNIEKEHVGKKVTGLTHTEGWQD